MQRPVVALGFVGVLGNLGIELQAALGGKTLVFEPARLTWRVHLAAAVGLKVIAAMRARRDDLAVDGRGVFGNIPHHHRAFDLLWRRGELVVSHHWKPVAIHHPAISVNVACPHPRPRAHQTRNTITNKTHTNSTYCSVVIAGHYSG